MLMLTHIIKMFAYWFVNYTGTKFGLLSNHIYFPMLLIVSVWKKTIFIMWVKYASLFYPVINVLAFLHPSTLLNK